MILGDINRMTALQAMLEHSGTIAQQPDPTQQTLSATQRESIRIEICQHAWALTGRWCPEAEIKTSFNPQGTVIVPGISPA